MRKTPPKIAAHAPLAVRVELGPPRTSEEAARVRYRELCLRCHGADGSGSPEKPHEAALPDFRSRDWQGQRSDAPLVASILGGTEGGMPAFRRLSEAEAQALVGYLRRFASAAQAGADREDK
jgi:mono/diheme cytochrome c family protein